MRDEAMELQEVELVAAAARPTEEGAICAGICIINSHECCQSWREAQRGARWVIELHREQVEIKAANNRQTRGNVRNCESQR